EFGDRIGGAELEHAERRHADAVPRHRGELERAARIVAVGASHRLLEEAVHIPDESSVASSGEDRAIAAVEHLASDGARVLEAARVEEVLGGDEVFQLALELFGDGARVGVEQHGDTLAARNRKSFYVAQAWLLAFAPYAM